MPSYEFAAGSAAKDENFKPLWLRHSIFSMCEVHYLTGDVPILLLPIFDEPYAGWPAGDRPFSRATASLFRIKAPADLGPCGVDVDRVVRPRPEFIGAPPPPED